MSGTSANALRSCCGLLLTNLLLAPAVVSAQTTFDVPTPATNTVVKGKPYEANKVSHTKRSLADGTVITQDMQIHEARDSSGRLLVEVDTSIPSGPSHAAKTLEVDIVTDPNAGTTLTWNNLTKRATLIHRKSPEFSSLASAAVSGKILPPSVTEPELLGHRMIHGLMTTGRRTQKAVPAGTLGNVTATDTEREWWTDDDLQLTVLSTSRSPQRGEQTIELANLKLVEPDPSRFHPPAGYALEEIGKPASSVHLLGAAALPLDLANAPALSHADALLKLSSGDTNEKRSAAAALVRDAQASPNADLKADTAYRLARANVGLTEASQLALQAVQSAEVATSTQPIDNVSRIAFDREATLCRYWHTLGYVYSRQKNETLAREFLESAWLLDPHGYYATHLGRLLEDAGDINAAVQIYREALAAPGGEDEKASLRDRIEALSGIADVQPLDMPQQPLTGTPAPTDGTATFDLIYSANRPVPEAVFVNGTTTLKPLAPTIAASAGKNFVLPDKGPEIIVRRVELTCKSASGSPCQLRFMAALEARALIGN